MCIVILNHFYINIRSDQSCFMEKILNTLTVPFEKSKIFALTFSRMKSIIVLQAQSKFLTKLFYCIAFGSALSTCCLLESIAIKL